MKRLTLGQLKKSVDLLLETCSAETPVAVNVDTFTWSIQEANIREVAGVRLQSEELVDDDGSPLRCESGDVRQNRMIVLFGESENTTLDSNEQFTNILHSMVQHLLDMSNQTFVDNLSPEEIEASAQRMRKSELLLKQKYLGKTQAEK